MAYSNDKLHPLDPGISQGDRPEGQTIEEAAAEILRRRNRAIVRRQFDLLDQAADRARGPYGEDDGLDGDGLT